MKTPASRYRTRAVASFFALAAVCVSAGFFLPNAQPGAEAAVGDPARLYVGAAQVGDPIGEVWSASPTPLDCPSDTVLVGVQTENHDEDPITNANGILVRVNILCAPVTVDVGGVVRTGAVETFNSVVFDQGRGNLETAQCQPGQAVHRISGTTFVGQGAVRWPSQIQVVCRPLTVTGAGQMRVDLSAAPETLTAGTNYNTNGGLVTTPLQCGPADTTGISPVLVRGLRLQGGGEGFDGFSPACTSIPRDFGDAPASYGSASHELNAATYLGWAVDAEPGMQSSPNATGDDQVSGTAPNANIDDEDGVDLFPSLVATSTDTYTVQVTVANKAPLTDATLTGWIDFNRNGAFDTTERASVSVPAGTPDGTQATLTWTGIATSTVPGATFARLRIETATVPATPTGDGASGEVEDHALQIDPPAPALAVQKIATPSTIAAAADVVTYSFDVENIGNIPLTGVTVNDTDFTGTGPIEFISCPNTQALLLPGQHRVCTARYSATQSDVDTGEVTNTAAASASTQLGAPVSSAPSTAVVHAAPTPSLSIAKSASPSDPASYIVGTTITYTFVATNTGNVSLSNVSVHDTNFTGTGQLSPVTCPRDDTALAPGAQLLCTATYALTQRDIDAGTVSNSAYAAGTSPRGQSIESAPTRTRIPDAARPAIALTKTVDATQITRPGQTLTYSFVATNIGNVKLTNPIIREGAFNGAGSLSAVSCPAGQAQSLAPGQNITCTATYTVVSADLSNKSALQNTATVDATTPSGAPAQSAGSTASVNVAPGVSVHTGGSTSTAALRWETPMWAAILITAAMTIVVRLMPTRRPEQET